MSQTPEEPIRDDPTDEELRSGELESAEEQYDEVYEPDRDPDLASARAGSEEDPEHDALVTDELRPEGETTEFDAPDRASRPTRLRETPFEEEQGETIDDRLPQEEPEDQP